MEKRYELHLFNLQINERLQIKLRSAVSCQQ